MPDRQGARASGQKKNNIADIMKRKADGAVIYVAPSVFLSYNVKINIV